MSARPSSRRESTADRERTRDGGRGDGSGERRAVAAEEDEEDRIGPYGIGDEIGRGSFATVFRGRRIVSR
jgi:serine/threonine-protein kinase ULK/ATG1